MNLPLFNFFNVASRKGKFTYASNSISIVHHCFRNRKQIMISHIFPNSIPQTSVCLQ